MKPNTTINNFYIIITGIFKYDKNALIKDGLPKGYCNWKHRINKGDYKNTFEHLDRNYYDSYIINVLPEVRQEVEAFKNPELLNHLTKEDLIKSPIPFSFNIPNLDIKGQIPFIDVFLFPNEIGLFSIKFEFIEQGQLTIENISAFTKRIRQPETVIRIEGKELNVSKFIETEIIANLPVNNDWNSYNPTFKSYSIIDLDNSGQASDIDHLLYDLGNMSELGSASGKGVYAPSEKYFEEQMENNKISVFKNWSALCLFDTFTRISFNMKDNFKVWEYDYFNIYINTLYIKSFMYLTNTELSDVTKATRQTSEIKDKFVEFINDYYLSHISYKFLPNLLYNKVLYAMEIHTEIEKMETKIQRINESFQKKREITLNKALAIIIFLSLFSVIYDLSSWLEEMGAKSNWIYPYGSISILLAIIAVLIVIFKMTGRK
ncbi:MAG: hypothetical protein DRJ05_05065 [Bacteroidetes bacterium]|nr:MAG: hypothetical protein DRJ05_05065 [Bacteroidota bacterium]